VRVIDTFRTVLSLAYSPCGRFLYTAGWQHVSRWDVRTGDEEPIIQRGVEGYCQSLRVSPRGDQMAWLIQSNGISPWQLRFGTTKPRRLTHDSVQSRKPNRGDSAAFGFLSNGRVVTHTDDLVMSPDGKRVAYLDGNTVQLTKVTARGNPDDAPIVLSALVQNATITIDGQPTAFGFASSELFWSTDGATVRVRDVTTQELVRSTPSEFVPAVITPDGHTGIATSRREVLLIDLSSGLPKVRYNWDVGTVETVAVAPDGLTVAVVGWSGSIAIFDLDG
jgi:WD40 repeat protein